MAGGGLVVRFCFDAGRERYVLGNQVAVGVVPVLDLLLRGGINFPLGLGLGFNFFPDASLGFRDVVFGVELGEDHF